MMNRCWVWLCGLGLGVASLSAQPYQVVKEGVIDLHRAPGPLEEVVTQAIYGTPLEIRDQEGEWVQVQTPDLYLGWVSREALIEAAPADPSNEMAMVKSNAAHLYRIPDVKPHPPMMTLPFESRLEILDQSEFDWVRVRLVDGREGWIMRSDVELHPQPLSLHEMVELSPQFNRICYRWGGSSSFGFDCSGLVQMLYRQTGLLLPRDSHLQYGLAEAVAIEIDALEPGDLLFFGEEGVNHVGLYLGDSRFIHALAISPTAPPGIQVSSLDDKPWDGRYRGARRVSHLIPETVA